MKNDATRFSGFSSRMRMPVLIAKILPIFLLFTLQLAATNHAQDIINLKARDELVGDVFKKIEKTTAYRFYYSNDVLSNELRVSISVQNASITEVMNRLLAGSNLRWRLFNKNKIIVAEKADSSYFNVQAVQIQSSTGSNEVAAIDVTGTVTDDTGLPLERVSIRLQGTTLGTFTDEKGRFKLTIPNIGGKLIFSYINYDNVELVINDTQPVKVAMKLKDAALEEVVVVGYGTQKKRSITASVATIKGAEIVKSPVANITNALVGRLPGLRATQRSGEPGYDGSGIDIRGFGNALVIVDGVPSEFSQLDPNEIEDFSILKDASAAVYGVRAANGVVLVTTKKGKTGAAQIDYNTNYGFQSIAKYPELADAATFAELSNEAAVNSWIKLNNPAQSVNLPFTKQQVEDYKSGKLPSTDWFGAAIRKNAPMQYQNVNVRGGREDIKYFFNLGYLGQSGIWRSDDTKYKRYNFRSNINAKIGKRITAELNVGGRLEDRSFPGAGAGFLVGSIQRSFPTVPIYANDNPAYFAPPNNKHQNAVFLMDKNNSGYAKDLRKILTGILTLNYEVPYVDGLTAKMLYSYESQDFDFKSYTKKYSLYRYDKDADKYIVDFVGNDPSRLNTTTSQNDKSILQASLNYSRVFAGKHNVSASYIFERQLITVSNFNAYREFLLQNLDELFAGVSTNQNNSGSSAEMARMGYIGKLNYDYAGKYLFEFGFRYDGSYKFPENSRFGFFPNFSVGWRLSDEPFLRDVTAIDNLKLRASWGNVGDDGGDDPNASNYIRPFQFITGFTYPSGTYNFGQGLIPGLADKGLPNNSLTWFESTTSNVGMEVSFLKGLIGMELDVFYRKRTGLLATRALSLPNTFGAALPQENLNGDNTRGFELVFTHKKSKGKFQYSVSPNITWTKTQWGYLERAPSTNDLNNWINNGTNRWTNQFRGLVAEGQFQSQEEIYKAPIQDDNGNKTLLPGDIRYKDQNGDGIINNSDQAIIGRGTTPELFFGLGFNASYMGIDFSLLLQGASNFNAYFDAELQNPFFNNANSYQMFEDRWRRQDIYDPNSPWIPGKYPSTIISGTTNNQKVSTFWLKDATYLRIKNFDLGYTLPKHLTDRVGIRKVRVYASGQNIFTFDKIKFIDPESPTGRGSFYPQQKVWSFGLNIGF